ncbi:MAG: 2-oxoglutarate oxidoreductase [Deltaproteobacteria bacterium]|nr:MAG: 2-oxoglutarate oxidoreductase [Deltaproteobacteria bacterium]
MKKVYTRPKYLKPVANHYCPGCGHSIVHRLVAEVFEEMDIGERAIGVAPAGCAVLAYNYFDVDFVEGAHGRGCAIATGLKRRIPDAVVFSYQGDGDLAAIGTAETIHAAARGENITIVFVNNGIYGMTGGQMAPTTILGMKATTAPFGRDAKREGYNLDITHLVAEIEGTAYAARGLITSPKEIRKSKKMIADAFQCQLDNRGLSIVELVSPCPTNWGMQPLASVKWIEETFTKHYTPGVLVERRPVSG